MHTTPVTQFTTANGAVYTIRGSVEHGSITRTAFHPVVDRLSYKPLPNTITDRPFIADEPPTIGRQFVFFVGGTRVTTGAVRTIV